jgi:hypothetical protein
MARTCAKSTKNRDLGMAQKMLRPYGAKGKKNSELLEIPQKRLREIGEQLFWTLGLLRQKLSFF